MWFEDICVSLPIHPPFYLLIIYKACSFWWVKQLTVMHILAFVYTSYLSMICTISCAHTILCRPMISRVYWKHECIKLGWSSPQSSPHSSPRNISLMQLWIYIFFKKSCHLRKMQLRNSHKKRVPKNCFLETFIINSFLQNENHD